MSSWDRRGGCGDQRVGAGDYACRPRDRDVPFVQWPDAMYAENEAVPVDIDDLGTLVSSKPRGPVATRLKWHTLSDDDFERMIFVLISSVHGYENPEWLTKTNAPDRGRDLSVTRVYDDELGGTVRHRVIIQCKHWQSKSVGVGELALLKEQMRARSRSRTAG